MKISRAAQVSSEEMGDAYGRFTFVSCFAMCSAIDGLMICASDSPFEAIDTSDEDAGTDPRGFTAGTSAPTTPAAFTRFDRNDQEVREPPVSKLLKSLSSTAGQRQLTTGKKKSHPDYLVHSCLIKPS
jgi:hypothetical protein